MALTPTQAKEMLPDDKAAVKSLEMVIDSAIQATYQDGGFKVTLAFSIFPNVRVRKACEEIYRKAGWDWKEVSDQRDGDFITLSPSNDPSRYTRPSDYRNQ